jgi:hypothetical protein
MPLWPIPESVDVVDEFGPFDLEHEDLLDELEKKGA